MGGSILTGVHKSLHPVYISGGEENMEILVIEAKLGDFSCRFMNGYGPQEYQNIEERIKFYGYLEQEVINAKMFDKLICIEMDANAKLGSGIIKSDSHSRSSNGDLLLQLCVRNNLVICNATDLCEGAITRQRNTVNGIEKSILDYFILCEEMFNYLSSMKVDEARAYVLSKYSKVKGKVKVTESDHNPLICKFDLLWSSELDCEKQRYEIFNYKDPEGIIKFNDLTSSSTLLNCVQGNVKQSSKKWLKAFKNILHRSFSKIRIKSKQRKSEEIHELMKMKTQLVRKIG